MATLEEIYDAALQAFYNTHLQARIDELNTKIRTFNIFKLNTLQQNKQDIGLKIVAALISVLRDRNASDTSLRKKLIDALYDPELIITWLSKLDASNQVLAAHAILKAIDDSSISERSTMQKIINSFGNNASTSLNAWYTTPTHQIIDEHFPQHTEFANFIAKPKARMEFDINAGLHLRIKHNPAYNSATIEMFAIQAQQLGQALGIAKIESTAKSQVVTFPSFNNLQIVYKAGGCQDTKFKSTSNSWEPRIIISGTAGTHELSINTDYSVEFLDFHAFANVHIKSKKILTLHDVHIGDEENPAALDITAHGCVLSSKIYLSTSLLLNTDSISQHETSEVIAGEHIFMLAKVSADLKGKLSSNTRLAMRAEGTLSYNILDWHAPYIELQVSKVSHMQFPKNVNNSSGFEITGACVDGAVSYALIAGDATPVQISTDCYFPELRLIVPKNQIIVGTSAQKATLTGNRLLLDCLSSNVHHGGVFGAAALIINNRSNGKVGHIDFSTTVTYGQFLPALPSYVGSNTFLFLNAPDILTLHHAELVVPNGEAWLRASKLDNISSTVHVAKDAFVDIPQIINTVYYEHLPTGPTTKVDLPADIHHPSCIHEQSVTTEQALQVKTPSPICMVYGTLHFSPRTNVSLIGAIMYAAKIDGPAPDPANIQTISQIQVQNYMRKLGHKKARKAGWYSDRKVLHAATFLARLSSGDNIDLQAQDQMTRTTGLITSRTAINAMVQNCTLAVASPDQRVIVQGFHPVVNLYTNERPSFLYAHSNNPNKPYMVPTVPIVKFNVPKFEPSILMPNRSFTHGNINNIRKRYPAERELEIILPKIIELLGHINLSGTGISPVEVWHKLHLNTEQWLANNPEFTRTVTQQNIESAVEPMLFYIPTIVTNADGSTESLLDLTIYLPRHLYKQALLTNSGAWFAEVIRIEGKSMEILGVLMAADKLEVDLDSLTLTQPKLIATKMITQKKTTSSLLGKSTATQTATVTQETLQSGGQLFAGNEISLKVREFIATGGAILCEKGDIKIYAKQLIDLRCQNGIYYVEHQASGRTALKKISVSEQLARHILSATTIAAAGNVTLEVEEGLLHDVAAQMQGKNVTLLVKNGDRISECALVTEKQGTTFNRKKLLLTQVNSSIERGLTPQVLAKESIKQAASGVVKMTAPTLMAPVISITGEQGVTISAHKLNQYLLARTSGLANATTYLQSTTEMHQQTALLPVIGGFSELHISSANGAIELESLQAQGVMHSKFVVQAQKDKIIFSTVKLINYSKTTSTTVGISFTASDALNAAISGDLKASIMSLGNEVPLLQPLLSLSNRGHQEDMMAHGMLLAFRVNEAINKGNLKGINNFGDYLKSNFGFNKDAQGKETWSLQNLRFGVRVGQTKTEEFSEQVIPGVIAVWETVLQAARDVELHSVQVDGKNLLVRAGGKICIIADEQQTKASSTTTGVSVTVNKGAVDVGADFSKSAASSSVYKSTVFNLEESISLQAEDSVEIAGILLKTAEGFISAKRVLIETLLNRRTQRQQSFSASTGGTVSASSQQTSTAWADVQAGIIASDALYIDASNQIALCGGAICLDGKSSIYQTPNGTALYRMAMPHDGDDLFHALGVSRLKAADDLLSKTLDPAIRAMVANDIARLLKTGFLPRIMANIPAVEALFQEFNNTGPNAEIDQRILQLCKTEDIYRQFVAFHVNTEGANLDINILNPQETNTIDAIATINQLSLTIWQKTLDGSLQSIHACNPPDAERHVEILAKVTTNDAANYMQFILLDADPMTIYTPVITHESLRGYEKSSGFSIQAGGLYNLLNNEKDSTAAPNNRHAIGTMFRSKRDMEYNASIVSAMTPKVTSRSGAAIDTSNINKDRARMVVTGDKKRTGVGAAGMQIEQAPRELVPTEINTPLEEQAKANAQHQNASIQAPKTNKVIENKTAPKTKSETQGKMSTTTTKVKSSVDSAEVKTTPAANLSQGEQQYKEQLALKKEKIAKLDKDISDLNNRIVHLRQKYSQDVATFSEQFKGKNNHGFNNGAIEQFISGASRAVLDAENQLATCTAKRNKRQDELKIFTEFGYKKFEPLTFKLKPGQTKVTFDAVIDQPTTLIDWIANVTERDLINNNPTTQVGATAYLKAYSRQIISSELGERQPQLKDTAGIVAGINIASLNKTGTLGKTRVDIDVLASQVEADLSVQHDQNNLSATASFGAATTLISAKARYEIPEICGSNYCLQWTPEAEANIGAGIQITGKFSKISTSNEDIYDMNANLGLSYGPGLFFRNRFRIRRFKTEEQEPRQQPSTGPTP